MWYPRTFGYRIEPYRSTAQAINTWPTTASAVGVRLIDDELEVCAPFGLGDLVALVVRPNRVQITEQIYDSKMRRWGERWPLLTVLPWSQGIVEPGFRHLPSG